MSRLPLLPARELIRALQQAGFQLLRQRGSHVRLRHEDGRLVGGLSLSAVLGRSSAVLCPRARARLTNTTNAHEHAPEHAFPNLWSIFRRQPSAVFLSVVGRHRSVVFKRPRSAVSRRLCLIPAVLGLPSVVYFPPSAVGCPRSFLSYSRGRPSAVCGRLTAVRGLFSA